MINLKILNEMQLFFFLLMKKNNGKRVTSVYSRFRWTLTNLFMKNIYTLQTGTSTIGIGTSHLTVGF